MELKKEHSKYIIKAFQKMKSKQDLLDLLNYCKVFLYTKNSFPISLSQLTYHSNPKVKSKRYNQFTIKKKSGSERIIHSPSPGLKCIQRCLNLIFQVIYQPSTSATGYVTGKSILDNALIHSGNNYVYNIDLKDFFNSIDQARIWGRLQNKPFNLNKSSGKLELANIIASLCCHEMEVERINSENKWQLIQKNVLPQGAPTSPTLTNIICQQLDYYLSATAKRFGLHYSRYADDITFSSMHNVYQENSEFIIELQRIVKTQNFHIKDTKTRLQKSGFRQKVTGLIVNEKPNLPPKYIKEIKMWLYFWNVYGYEKANDIFIKDLSKNEENSSKGSSNLQSVISGKLNFLKMIKGSEDNKYIKLKKTLDGLNTALKEQYKKTENIPLIDVEATNIETDNILKIPIIHHPEDLVRILKMFTVDNSILKYATHTWDAGKDENKFIGYEDFIKKAKKEFDKVNNELISLSPQLRAKILAFLFNKYIKEKGWGTHRIKVGWSSPEISEVMINNPNAKPENIYLPERLQFVHKTSQTSQTIQKFRQVIDIFKNEIEIRDENSALLNLILEFHDHYLEGFKIKAIKNLENKAFYTDVDYLRKVFTVIFRSIQTRILLNEVSYILIENPDSYSLEIIQHNSFCKGLSKNDEKFNLTRGDFSSIKNWLKNLCDWSIESEFKEGNYKINFLSSKPDDKRDEEVPQTEGFKHIFKFYK